MTRPALLLAAMLCATGAQAQLFPSFDRNMGQEAPAAAAAPSYALPDPKLTPGAVDPKLGYHQICDDKLPPRKKIKACTYRRYGIADNGHYEADHLIPRELGGADVCDNLWPQGWAEASAEDSCEDAMRIAYCSGPEPRPALADLQRAMATNWIEACRKYGLAR
jgi:hypothetical protein